MSKRSNPREKDVNNASYRQVSNYLSNELGIDRKFVEDVIEKKMESRNIPAMINRMVQRYFSWCRDIFTAISAHTMQKVRPRNGSTGILIMNLNI